MTLTTWRPVCQAGVLHQRACIPLTRRGRAVLLHAAVGPAVVATGHEHVRLLGVADGLGGFGDVWEVRQLGDVVQQAARLRVVGVAVGVAVLFLNVPAQFPALPRLQDFGLHLRKELRSVPSERRASDTCKRADSLLCSRSSTRWPPGDPVETPSKQ